MRTSTTCFPLAIVLALIGVAAADLPDFPPVDPKLPAATIPRPVVAHLDNGMTVMTVTVKRLPYVVVGWACRPGAAADPRMQAGMAFTVASGMITGTTHRGRDEIAEIVNSHGLLLQPDADYHALYMTLGTLPESLDVGMELLADVVRNPTYSEGPWEDLMRAVRQQQLINKRDPRALTVEALKRHVCGRHYYARSLYGTDITLSRLDAKGAQMFHQGYVGADRSVLLFCGMIEPQDACALAEKYFADWGPAANPLPTVMAPPKPGERHLFVLDDLRARRATITIGRIGVPRLDDEFPVLRMLTAVLAARLEEEAYGPLRAAVTRSQDEVVSVVMETGPTAGYFGITFAVPNQEVGRTIQIALDTCKKLGAEPAGLQYIEPAHARLSGKLTFSLERLDQLADQHLKANIAGLGLDWYDQLLAQLAAVTPEQLQEAAVKYLDPESLLTIVHANAADIKEFMVDLTPYDVIVGTPAPSPLEPPQ